MMSLPGPTTRHWRSSRHDSRARPENAVAWQPVLVRREEMERPEVVEAWTSRLYPTRPAWFAALK